MDDIDFAAADPAVTKERVKKVHEPEVEPLTLGLPAVQTFSTDLAAQRALEAKLLVDGILEQAKLISIVRDAETNMAAVSIAASAKGLYKQLEEVRHHFTDPHHTFKKKVDAFFKIYTDPLLQAEARLVRLISGFRSFRETERRRLQAEQDQAAAKLSKEVEAEAAEFAAKGVHYDPVTVVAPVVPEVPKTTRVEEGSAHQRRSWTHEIINIIDIPREYLLVDEQKIRQAIKAGVREIPGVRIFEDYITHIRT